MGTVDRRPTTTVLAVLLLPDDEKWQQENEKMCVIFIDKNV